MKLSKQAINLFEQLATNAHHKVTINTLLAEQAPEIKEIYFSNSSQYVKNYFDKTGYSADSVKVTEI